ncbi:MAG: lipopolysaccharide kinase InaA family protein [Thermodesulfobacteriota bacterium]|nr:lipopolysaccharide kinase InaA family protein [Thermodesulfobacteriota bacterium]
MIDTTATRYRFKAFAKDIHVLDGWKEFLQACGLNIFENFIVLTGEVVDRNSRSVVHRIELGDPPKTFYLKCHKNYVKQKAYTFFRPKPMIYTEIENMMHYARAGFDALDPVAWGWQKGKGGGNSFLLIAELTGFISLQTCFNNDLIMGSVEKRLAISNALSSGLAVIHDAGLAHVDFFTWHVFIRPSLNGYKLQPIDLERSRKKGKMIWSSFTIKKKQIDDLASLHLTVPWPLVSFSERMRFFHDYRKKRGMSGSGRKFLKVILKRAKHRGRRRKFKPYGVAGKLRT